MQFWIGLGFQSASSWLLGLLVDCFRLFVALGLDLIRSSINLYTLWYPNWRRLYPLGLESMGLAIGFELEWLL